MHTLTINNKEYRFRERVSLGKLLRAERLRRQIDLTMLAPATGDGFFAQLQARRAWRTVNRLWSSLCAIVFENPDSGLSLEALTPAEIREIPLRFFAFMEKNVKPSGASAKPSPSSPPAETTP